MEGCCSKQEGSKGEVEELFDPAMSECCIRDAIEQRKIENAKARLRAVDVSMKALDMRSQVFPSNETHHSDSSQISKQEESDDDPVLKEIRDRRIRELEKRVQSNKEPSTKGVTTLSDSDALEGALKADSLPSIVHIAVPSSEASGCFDELLDRLAFEYSKTRFFRLVCEKHGSKQFLKMDAKASPAVACFRNGSLVAQTSLLSFLWDGDLVEEKVERFFRKLHVLKKSREGGQESLSGGSDDEDPWLEDPCDVCGRRYPHKHFGPANVYDDKLETSDDESE